MYLISTFDNSDLSGEIFYERLHNIIKGKFKSPGVHTFRFWAAAPADLRLSYSGSGLPFASEEMAMTNTPNQGVITTNGFGEFEFDIFAPNSYYTCQGINFVPPQLHLYDHEANKQYTINLGPAIPNRSLRHLDGMPDRSYRR